MKAIDKLPPRWLSTIANLPDAARTSIFIIFPAAMTGKILVPWPTPEAGKEVLPWAKVDFGMLHGLCGGLPGSKDIIEGVRHADVLFHGRFNPLRES
jgi:hypothetical protein